MQRFVSYRDKRKTKKQKKLSDDAKDNTVVDTTVSNNSSMTLILYKYRTLTHQDDWDGERPFYRSGEHWRRASGRPSTTWKH